MIDRTHALPVSRQVKLVDVARSTAYDKDKAQPMSEAKLALMHRMDAWHLERAFAGTRRLSCLRSREGIPAGRRHVGTLMKRMGIEALYRRPHTSGKHAGHKIWPYLRRGRTIDQANQVWALDTTDILMARGFVSLTAVVDGASGWVLAHRVAITPESGHAVCALEEAFAGYGQPEIVNTDQGQPVQCD